jgi:hypothetical protein
MINRHCFCLVVLLFLIACGPEAPPRANRPGNLPPSVGTPLIEQANRGRLLSEQNPDPRTKGDPDAPIVMIEYGDYQ